MDVGGTSTHTGPLQSSQEGREDSLYIRDRLWNRSFYLRTVALLNRCAGATLWSNYPSRYLALVLGKRQPAAVLLNGMATLQEIILGQEFEKEFINFLVQDQR